MTANTAPSFTTIGELPDIYRRSGFERRTMQARRRLLVGRRIFNCIGFVLDAAPLLEPERTRIALEKLTYYGNNSIVHASILQPLELGHTALFAEKMDRTGVGDIIEIRLGRGLNRRLLDNNCTATAQEPFIGAYSSKHRTYWRYDARQATKNEIFIMPHSLGLWFLDALANHPGDTGTHWKNAVDLRMQLEGIPSVHLP